METATPDQIRSYLADNQLTLRMWALGCVLLIGALLVFTAALARLVRAHLPGAMHADLILAAGVLVTFRFWIEAGTESHTLVQALDGTGADNVPDATLQAWYAITNITHFMADLWIAPVAILMITFSLAGRRTRLISRWLAWAGIIAGTAGAIGTLSAALAWPPLTPGWFIGLFGFVLWTPLVGGALGLPVLRARRGLTRHETA